MHKPKSSNEKNNEELFKIRSMVQKARFPFNRIILNILNNVYFY